MIPTMKWTSVRGIPAIAGVRAELMEKLAYRDNGAGRPQSTLPVGGRWGGGLKGGPACQNAGLGWNKDRWCSAFPRLAMAPAMRDAFSDAIRYTTLPEKSYMWLPRMPEPSEIPDVSQAKRPYAQYLRL